MNPIYVICVSSDNFSFFDFNLFKIKTIIFSKMYIIFIRNKYLKKELSFI